MNHSFIYHNFLGPGGTPRPIELHSHDPLRYVGDMLAWLHQAAASEKEYVQSLIKKCTGNDLHFNQIQSIYIFQILNSRYL